MSIDTATALNETIDDGNVEPLLTLEDLLRSESEVLRRVAQSQSPSNPTGGHYSSTGGHNMSGQHSSHTMAQSEQLLDRK